jgi:predicted fused transcriptional regulator/phosphomethylpyrimidine kinase
MSSVYVVIENGEPYANVYTSFASAKAAVNAKYAEEIAEQIRESEGYPICSKIDEPENISTGITYLYVEKGIQIYIYKLPIAV